MYSDRDIAILSKWANYAHYVLGLDLYPWQRDVYSHLDQAGTQYLLTCCNEGGKTSTVAAPLAVIHAETIPGSTCFYTSASDHQIKNQFLPAFRKYATQARGWTIKEHDRQAVYGPTGSMVFFLKSDDPGKMEGFHATGNDSRYKSLLVIADEAKSIPDPIYEAIVRCSATRFLAISSTSTQKVNWFHQETTAPTVPATTRRAKVIWTDCPHLCHDPEKRRQIEAEIAKFGPDHPLIRSKYYSEWPTGGQGLVFDLDAVTVCMSGMVPHVGSGRKSGGFDLSGGGDEQVLYLADGNRVLPAHCFNERKHHHLAELIIPILQTNYVPPHMVWADGTGLGEPILQIFDQARWVFNREVFSETANDSSAYTNRRTEMAFQAALWIQQRQVSLPYDLELKQQLSWFRYKIDEKGKLSLLPKDKMPHSPDRADSLIMLLANMRDWGLAPRLTDPNKLAPNTSSTYDDNSRYGGFEW